MLNPTEEAKFAELKIKCRELKVPAPSEIMIGLKVHDKNGVLVFDDIQRGHSWTRNAWNRFCGMALDCVAYGSSSMSAGNLCTRETAGWYDASTTVGWQRSQTYAWPGYGFWNNTTSNTFGIQIGTNDTASALTDYVLSGLIASGNGSGQMAYQAQNTPVTTYDSKIFTATYSRIFNNNSGGSITIKETGMVYSGHSNSGLSLQERSVLDPTVAVANAAQLTVTY
jgi:hypothetical protein